MQIFSLRKGNSFAIDLGNNNTILSKVDSSLSHPSLVVLNKSDNTIKAVGKEAFEMLGKVQDNLKVIKPLKEGLIADFNSTRDMLKALVGSAYPKSSLLSGFDYIIAGVPYASTEVERRALRDSLEQFNSSKTYLIFEPIAAAIGMDVVIRRARPHVALGVLAALVSLVLLMAMGTIGILVNRSALRAADTLLKDLG